LNKKDRLNIISLILEVSSNTDNSKNSQKITTPNILYNTLLNHSRLREYWTALTEVGLLGFDSTTGTFKTTEKGLRFLEVFSGLDQQTREEEEQQCRRSNNKNNNNNKNINDNLITLAKHKRMTKRFKHLSRRLKY
jgi:predicted transcriptional regulator